MKRREFNALLIAYVAWPSDAHAQQRASLTIGFLSSRSPGESSHLLAAVTNGLREGGEGRFGDIQVEYRWADGKFERLPELAADLVRLNVSAILSAGNTVSAVAAKQATTSIPIVFVIGDDPIKAGLVTSLNRPTGNITGVTVLGTTLEAERLELLHQLVPASTLGFLVNPNNANREQVTAEVQEAARTLNERLVVVSAASEADFEAAFAQLVGQGAAAIAVAADPIFTIRRQRLIALAAQNRLPAIYQWREFADDGGLMSYGTNLADAYRRAAVYAARILLGAKPAELPVQQAAKFEMVINLKTAKALGLTVPPTLLARADEVIE